MIVGDWQGLIRRQRDAVREIDAFSIKPCLACPKDGLETVPLKRRDAVFGVVRRHSASCRVMCKGNAFNADGIEGPEIDGDTPASGANLYRGHLGFIEIDFDKPLDQRKVDFVPVSRPAGKPDAPSSKGTSPPPISASCATSNALVEDQRLPNRPLSDRPRKPDRLDPISDRILNFRPVLKPEPEIPLWDSCRRGQHGLCTVFGTDDA